MTLGCCQIIECSSLLHSACGGQKMLTLGPMETLGGWEQFLGKGLDI